MTSLRFLLVALTTFPAIAQESATVFEPFEGDGFGTWTETGDAFGMAPTAGGQGQLAGKVQGFAQDSFACSFAKESAGKGTLTSPEFTIEPPYIRLLVGGASSAQLTEVQLLVGDKVVRRETGQDDLILRPTTWDVRELKGKKAHFKLLDQSEKAGGFIMADHILFANKANAPFPPATEGGQAQKIPLVSSPLPGVTVPKGTELTVYATFKDHGVVSPTALCIDEQGRLLITETHRFRFGIPDNRDHRYWHTDDIAATTVEDRLKMHQKWDKRYPVKAMAEKTEKIRLLMDNNGDGVADLSNVFAEDFNDPLDGTAAGIYSYKGNVYFACIPHIWLLKDTDNDGKADERTKMVSGFGLRVSLSGHDLNGFALGPDGRLYGTVGDRAMNVTTADGRVFEYTDQGAAFRFDPDGSNFEVIHAGLRNPKEIAFDKFGNAFSVDNNSDQGDKARVVYIVDGADSGWRTDHQNLHTFHREVGYPKRPINQWMQERQWDVHHDGQPAFLLPPVDTLTSGPSGLTYQPGTGYSNNCLDSFLVCDYRGGPASSGIWAFEIEPNGAGMRMKNARQFNWGAAVTDVEFGYDGRLYVTDFITGWKSHQNGRVYSLSSKESRESALTKQVTALFRDGFEKQSAVQLFDLLGHPDQRVRLRAQIELAARPEAVPFFINATKQTENRLQRLHGVWGLWIRARKEASEASTEQLMNLLGDPDAEVRAQAARALGESPLKDNGRLINSLQDPSDRVKFFAAIALTRLRAKDAFNSTLILLGENADKDPYLRHAGAMLLLGAADERLISSLAQHPNRSIRMAAVLALRRLHSPSLVQFFFQKEDPQLSDEAIRAVHDVPIEKARPAVAALLDEYAPGQNGRPLTRMMLRRLLHSAFRVGGAENAARLLRAAANDKLDQNERLEALRLLSVWTKPPKVDQSLGRYAPLDPRPLEDIKSHLEKEIGPLLSGQGPTLAAAIDLVTRYELSIDGLDQKALASILKTKALGAEARVRALELLVKRKPENLGELLLPLADSDEATLAAKALELLVKHEPEAAVAPLKKSLASNDLKQAQGAWKVLAKIPGEDAAKLIEQGVRDLKDGKIPAGIALEVVEAAGIREEESVQNAFGEYMAALPSDDALAPFRISLQGGDPELGRAIFHTHPAGQCLRCHRIDQGHVEGGQAGPNLAGIGARRSSEHLLESLIVPGAKVAPGFALVSITFQNGATKSGLVTAEDEEIVDLLEGETLWRIKKTDIKSQSKPVSAMAPPMGAVMSKREIRDLVAWLTAEKKGTPPAPPKRETKDLDPATLITTETEQDPPKPEEPPEEANPTVTKNGEEEPKEESPTGEVPEAVAEPKVDLEALTSLGKTLYVACAACHGQLGEGVDKVGPPLARSEWVLGPPENLIRIQFRGLKDDITVKGKKYILGVDIPVSGMTPLFQDPNQMAAVLTYIRTAFGNDASPITPAMAEAWKAEQGKPPLKVADLIPPTRPTQIASEETKESGPTIRTILIVVGVLLWCGLCALPVMKRMGAKGSK